MAFLCLEMLTLHPEQIIIYILLVLCFFSFFFYFNLSEIFLNVVCGLGI